MPHRPPVYRAEPDTAPDAASGSATTTIVIIVAAVIGAAVLIGVLALALGLGLGLGLRDRDSSSTSTLTAPSVSCNSTESKCGCPAVSPSYSSRIISGTTATTNSWPWLVYLTIGSRVCTGFLVSSIHVVTAANCIYGINSTTITAYLGVNKRSDSGAVIRNITNVTYPPEYVTGSTANDIAFLQLGESVQTNLTNIKACCVTNTTSDPAEGTIGVIAGWGETSTTGSPSDTLQQAVIKVQGTSTCGISSTFSRFCAGYDTIRTCLGDNGAPFMSVVNNTWTCSGVVSRGSSSCNHYAVYARVSYFYDKYLGS